MYYNLERSLSHLCTGIMSSLFRHILALQKWSFGQIQFYLLSFQISRCVFAIIITFKSVCKLAPNLEKHSTCIDVVTYIRKTGIAVVSLARKCCISVEALTTALQISKVDVSYLTQNHYLFGEHL